MDLPRLFCFPHAGGGAHAFRPLAQALAGRVEVIGVDLPGRGRLRAMPCADDWDSLLPTLTDALAARTGRPFALLGHSLGALVALEMARRLRAGPLLALFACGCPPPGTVRPARALHRLDDRAMFEALQALGGISQELLDSPELIALAAPALRADLTLFETHRDAPRPPLDVPVFAYRGADDAALVGAGDGWARQTRAGLRGRTLPGGHMFLHEQVAAAATAIAADLAACQRQPLAAGAFGRVA